MKFGKRLKWQIEATLPEWRDKFLSYKDLKKRVRMICTRKTFPKESELTAASKITGKEEDHWFILLLDEERDKFNSFFMEQEEEFIIRRKDRSCKRGLTACVLVALGPNGSSASERVYKQEMGRLRKEMVNFYGEMVLLENYSNLNYTGIAKILKRYDKRTGGFLRPPFIHKVLQQPVLTTDLLSKMIKETDGTLQAVFPAVDNHQEPGGNNIDIAEVDGDIFRNTVAALVTMKEIIKGESTYKDFSLPPLNTFKLMLPVQFIP